MLVIFISTYGFMAIATCVATLFAWARKKALDGGDAGAAMLFGLVWPVVWLFWLPASGLAWCVNRIAISAGWRR